MIFQATLEYWVGSFINVAPTVATYMLCAVMLSVAFHICQVIGLLISGLALPLGREGNEDRESCLEENAAYVKLLPSGMQCLIKWRSGELYAGSDMVVSSRP